MELFLNLTHPVICSCRLLLSTVHIFESLSICPTSHGENDNTLAYCVCSWSVRTLPVEIVRAVDLIGNFRLVPLNLNIHKMTFSVWVSQVCLCGQDVEEFKSITHLRRKAILAGPIEIWVTLRWDILSNNVKWHLYRLHCPCPIF